MGRVHRTASNASNKKTSSSKKRVKYCTYNKSGKYVVQRFINNERVYFGSCKTLEDAERLVDALKKHNWDFDEIPEDIKKLSSLHGKSITIKYCNNKYMIIGKTRNNRNKLIGSYTTLEEAERRVEEIKLNKREE